MTRYEYKVVPAPRKAGKVKGVKGTDARFAHELAQLMNEYGADGWEYQRTDTLPCEERSGLTSKVTKFQNVLVFRRDLSAPIPVIASVPKEETPVRVVAAPEATDEAAPARSPLQAVKPEEETGGKSSGDLTAH